MSRYEKFKYKINSILESYNQSLRVRHIESEHIILSNGLRLDDSKDVKKFKNRISRGSDIIKYSLDKLYHIDSVVRSQATEQIHKDKCSLGGKAAQLQHRDTILKNLNTGDDGPWNKDLKGNYPYTPMFSEETRKKISESKKGKNNAMYGRQHSDEYKKIASERMKKKILNGEFTPNSNNRNTHWNSSFNDKVYRSSWEALYQYFDNDADYEVIRIPYVFNDTECVYIVDFVNIHDKTLVEVKPRCLTTDERTMSKISAAKEWCYDNGYSFIIADEKYFYNKGEPDDYSRFDTTTQDKIRRFYARNK